MLFLFFPDPEALLELKALWLGVMDILTLRHGHEHRKSGEPVAFLPVRGVEPTLTED
uniref:Uncharacterized protein n=1 Tax=Arion vulgaris TaxID=1028688 RepID=A0A0B7B9M9_9EUPU